MKRERVIAFTRQNTGKHFLDSGFSSGRIWQQPAPAENTDVILDEYPLISVTQWLVDCAEEQSEIMVAFDKAAEEDERANWFEIGARTMKDLDYIQIVRGNTCNDDNDLDQGFLYEIWMPTDEDGWVIEEDWIYCEDAICVMYLHTGADIRGGYSAPLAVKWTCEYSIPMNYCVEYHCEGEEGSEGGRYECGYSGNPRYQLEKDGFTFKEVAKDGLIFEREGEDFLFHVSRPYIGE